MYRAGDQASRAEGAGEVNAEPRKDTPPAASGSVAVPRVGVIGCGYWGPQLIRNFAQLTTGTLVAVADRIPERLDYVRNNHPGVVAVDDYRQLLDMDLEAVVIATPIDTHFAIAQEALQAGKDILVEKPLAMSVVDGMALIRLAEATSRIIMVGHTFLYNPAVQELRRIVRSGELGCAYYVDSARLNLGLFQRRANVIWDLAPHDISILLYILDSVPFAVSARGRCCVQPGIHDVAYLELQFPDDIGAHLHVSWLQPSKVRRTTVIGDRKMVVYDDVSLGEKIRIYDTGVEVPVTDSFGEFQLSYRYGAITIPYIPWQEPLRLECEHFIESVRTRSRPRTDSWQGLAVVAVIEAANASLADGGRRVPLNLPARSDADTLEPARLPAEAETNPVGVAAKIASTERVAS